MPLETTEFATAETSRESRTSAGILSNESFDTSVKASSDSAESRAIDNSPINPGSMNDADNMRTLLLQADAAHRKFEKDSGFEVDWPDFYANYLNDRVKAGGHQDLDVKSLNKIFQEAGEGHHQFEIQTGEEDKDWAGWYANFVVERLPQQKSK